MLNGDGVENVQKDNSSITNIEILLSMSTLIPIYA